MKIFRTPAIDYSYRVSGFQLRFVQYSQIVQQYSTRVPEYRNEMQMSDRKLYLLPHPKKFSIRQMERIGQIDKLQPGSQNIVKYF